MRIAPYMKSVAAVVSSVMALLTFLASMQGILPENIGATVAGILAIAGPVAVWFTRNTPLIEEAVDAVDELIETVDETVGAFQKRA